MSDPHEKREIQIFIAFANGCQLPIKVDSVKKMQPPEPDILCELGDKTFVAFELVEIIDRSFANMVGKQIDTKSSLTEYHFTLEPQLKNKLDQLFSNALIFPRFQNDLTMRQRQKLFPKIFQHLTTLQPGFEGETLKDSPEFRGKLRSISISRGRFNGPIFDQVASGSIGDPAVEAIELKFKKRYQSKYPIHLLGYIDLNPMFPDQIWLPSVSELVSGSLKFSQFQRVWIFDYQKNEVKFHYP